jgi:hypothetical protein
MLTKRLRIFPPLLLLPLLLISCTEDSSVVDPSVPDLPLSFTSLRLSAVVFDTDSIDVVAGRDKTPDDDVVVRIGVVATAAGGRGAPLPQIASARCSIAVSGSGEERGALDLASSDGTWSGTLELPIHRGDVGDYRFSLTGIDTRGIGANPMTAKITVRNGNNPPSFCGISAPDTVSLPAADTLLHLEVCVRDASGLKDIKYVLFNSYLPNGQPSNANPVFFYDDATHGDLTPGDGTYTCEILLPPTAPRGTYRFELQAADLGNLSSGVLIHRLVVR